MESTISFHKVFASLMNFYNISFRKGGQPTKDCKLIRNLVFCFASRDEAAYYAEADSGGGSGDAHPS